MEWKMFQFEMKWNKICEALTEMELKMNRKQFQFELKWNGK